MKTFLTLIGIGFCCFTQAQPPSDAPGLKQKAEAPADSGADWEGLRGSHLYKTVGSYKLELFVDAPEGHKTGAKVPAIVFFHGGGFRSGSETQFERQAAHLARRGMVAIRVRYRLTSDPSVKIRDCIEDAISAMRWVRANAGRLGIDPDRIAAGGGSAGGYLAAATLMIDSINAANDPAGVSAKPNAMVLFNPGFGNRGKDAADPHDPDGRVNLLDQVKPNQPPSLILHGKADMKVPFASVEAFTMAMRKEGNRCELVGYEGAGHGFFNQEQYGEPTLAEADRFLTGLGWLEKKADSP